METYQSLTGIQTFKNDLGLNLYVMPSMSCKVAISEEELERRN